MFHGSSSHFVCCDTWEVTANLLRCDGQEKEWASRLESAARREGVAEARLEAAAAAADAADAATAKAMQLQTAAVEAEHGKDVAELLHRLETVRQAHSEQEKIWVVGLETAASAEAMASEQAAAMADAAATRVADLEDKLRSSEARVVAASLSAQSVAELVQKLEEMRGAHSEQEEIWTSGLEDAAASVLLVSETRAALAAAEESGAAAAARVVELEDKLRSSEARVVAATLSAEREREALEGQLAAEKANAVELVRKLKKTRDAHREKEEIWAAKVEEAAVTTREVVTSEARVAEEKAAAAAAARVVELEEKLRSSEARAEAASTSGSGPAGRRAADKVEHTDLPGVDLVSSNMDFPPT